MDPEKRNALRRRLIEILGRLEIPNPEGRVDEFNLLTINEDLDDIREVARLVHERIDGYAKFLEDLLQPEGMAAMNECSFFSEEELRMVTVLYRRMMRLFRAFTRADLTQAYGDYLKQAFALWDAERERLLDLATRCEAGWSREEPLQTERSYFG